MDLGYANKTYSGPRSSVTLKSKNSHKFTFLKVVVISVWSCIQKFLYDNHLIIKIFIHVRRTFI